MFELFNVVLEFPNANCLPVSVTGKKGRVMERRLLKDFQIGMVEGIINDALSADKGGSKDVFSKIAKAIGRKATGAGSKKKDWNAIARQKSVGRDPIGSSSEAHIRRSRQSLRRHIIENQGSALTSMDPEKLIEYNPKLSEMRPSARVAYAKFKMAKIRAEYDNKAEDGKSLADEVFDGSVTVTNEKTQGSIIRPRPKPPSRTTSITSQKIPAPEDIKKLAEEKDFRSRTPIPEDPNERRTPTPEPASVKADIKPMTAAAPALKPPETKVQPPTPIKTPAPAPPTTETKSDPKTLTPKASVTKAAAPKPPETTAEKSPSGVAAKTDTSPKPPPAGGSKSEAKDDSKSTSVKASDGGEKTTSRITKPGGKSKVTGEVLTGWL